MTEEKQKTHMEEKEIKHEHQHTHAEKIEHKHEDEKEEKADEKKEAPIKTDKKSKEKPKAKKYEAFARSLSVPISKKHAMYICCAIKNKKIDDSIQYLNKVILYKQAVPFKGEIPHRKGSIMSGRYPIKASGYFINLLKALKGNALVNGLDLDKTRITIASANWAARPQRRGGTAAKRTHILLKAREFSEGEKLK